MAAALAKRAFVRPVPYLVGYGEQTADMLRFAPCAASAAAAASANCSAGILAAHQGSVRKAHVSVCWFINLQLLARCQQTQVAATHDAWVSRRDRREMPLCSVESPDDAQG